MSEPDGSNAGPNKTEMWVFGLVAASSLLQLPTHGVGVFFWFCLPLALASVVCFFLAWKRPDALRSSPGTFKRSRTSSALDMADKQPGGSPGNTD
jgi:hypothetical protein